MSKFHMSVLHGVIIGVFLRITFVGCITWQDESRYLSFKIVVFIEYVGVLLKLMSINDSHILGQINFHIFV